VTPDVADEVWLGATTFAVAGTSLAAFEAAGTTWLAIGSPGLDGALDQEGGVSLVTLP
jgi:hypothetical protein